MNKLHLCLPSAILPIFLLSLGCSGSGDKPIKIDGKVTLDGVDLPNAMIIFNPEEGKGTPAAGVSGSDGSFRLTTFNSNDGIRPGSYKVTVALNNKSEPDAQPVAPGDPKAMMEAMKKFAEANKAKPKKETGGLPATYSDPAKTTLKFVIPPPEGKLILDLRKSGS